MGRVAQTPVAAVGLLTLLPAALQPLNRHERTLEVADRHAPIGQFCALPQPRRSQTRRYRTSRRRAQMTVGRLPRVVAVHAHALAGPPWPDGLQRPGRSACAAAGCCSGSEPRNLPGADVSVG
jgi:hypothetical protein